MGESKLSITIQGIPRAKQSARFRIAKKGRKQFVMSYQKKTVKDRADSIKIQVKNQLPLNFKIYDNPIGVRVIFTFPPLKGWSKKKLRNTVYKDVKPDIDNLLKSLFDGMNGVVYTDDAKICEVSASKIFGLKAKTELEFYLL